MRPMLALLKGYARELILNVPGKSIDRTMHSRLRDAAVGFFWHNASIACIKCVVGRWSEKVVCIGGWY